METLIQDSSTQNRSNPFPGLRPFHREEQDLYFGRDHQVKEVLDKLMHNRFVAIIGVSGIGKSSFIYCGILPKLEEPQDTLEGINYKSGQWSTLSIKPGSFPFSNLVDQVQSFSQGTIKSNDSLVEHSLASLSEYNLDWFLDQFKKRSDYDPIAPPPYLIFIDQFEEVFSLEKQNSAQESLHFIHTIQALAAQTDIPIYITITLRSDFIGHCSQYPGFTEMINGSQFLIPYMTSQEKRDAICEPIRKRGGRISDELVDQVLKDVGNELVQLPLMQHALMRTWDAWEKSGDPMMDLLHYHKIGGVKDGLSKHANEVFKTLTKDQAIACAKVFKTLTKANLRQPTPLGKIAKIVDIPIQAVMEIVERFRRQDCGLLMPPPEVPLSPNSIIDISHESLITDWKDLKKWVQEEEESGRNFQRFVELALEQQDKKGPLMAGGQLEMAENWHNKQKPNEAWAERYRTRPEFLCYLKFLEASIEEEKHRAKAERELESRRNRQIRVVAIIFFLGAIVAGIFAYTSFLNSKKAFKNAREARKQRREALNQSEIAKTEKEKALKNELKAKINNIIAGVQEKKALLAREKELVQKKIAIQKAIDAENARNLATRKSKIAELEKEKAKVSAQLAEIAKLKALNLRVISIAKEMAFKSKDMEDSLQRKGLLAKQAYQFNRDFYGNPNDPVIYSSLYLAVKALVADKKAGTEGNYDYGNLRGHVANVRALIPYKGTEVFSAGSDGRIQRLNSQWKENTRLVVKEVSPVQQGKIHRSLALNPSKNTLACAGNYAFVQFFDPATLKPKENNLFFNHQAQVWYLDFLNDDLLVVADEVGGISIWDIKKQETLYQINKSRETIKGIATLNNQVFVALRDSLIRIREVADNQFKEEAYIQGSYLANSSLAISTQGKIALGQANGEIYVFFSKGNRFVLKGHKGRINQMAFDQRGEQLASGSWDGTVRIWNVRDVKSLDEVPITLDDHTDNQKIINYVWSITFSPEGKKLLVGCSNSLVRSWPTQTSEMADLLCGELLVRNLSQKEWIKYVDDSGEIEYLKTCDNLPSGLINLESEPVPVEE